MLPIRPLPINPTVVMKAATPGCHRSFRDPSAALAIERAAAAGVVGASVEDYDPGGRIYDLPHATERIAAAVETARGLGFGFMVTARAENHIRGNPDLGDTIARLTGVRASGRRCALRTPGCRFTPSWPSADMSPAVPPKHGAAVDARDTPTAAVRNQLCSVMSRHDI